MKILCKYVKKIKVHFLILWAFLENTCLMYISMRNGPVEGAITCAVKHKKVYCSKTHPIFFLIFAENVRLLFLNIIKLIPWGPQLQSIKCPALSPCDNRRMKWQLKTSGAPRTVGDSRTGPCNPEPTRVTGPYSNIK